MVEMWALRSLGDEVFKTGGVDIYSDPDTRWMSAKGYAWLREHLVIGYEAAWRQRLWNGDLDAAIATQGLSRWHNYYVEGLRWLMQQTGIDGLYLDGIGYDREIMKRVAKVMTRTNPRSRTNFHSENSFQPPRDRDHKTSPPTCTWSTSPTSAACGSVNCSTTMPHPTAGWSRSPAFPLG